MANNAVRIHRRVCAMMTRDQLGGVILCGGHSRRMGAPKEWMRAGDEFALVVVARELLLVAPQVVAAAREKQSLPPLPTGVEMVHDRFAGAGPLAGLAAGMEALKEKCAAIIVTPCDHPWVTAAILRRLVDELGDAPAIVPVHGDKVFALLGVYRTSLLSTLLSHLQNGDFRAAGFARSCGAKLVDAESLRDIDSNLISLRNVNSPDDLSRETV